MINALFYYVIYYAIIFLKQFNSRYILNLIHVSDLNIQDVSTEGAADYVPDDTTASFANGVEFVDMTFNIEADDVVEDLESFTITLENPSSGFVAEPGTATVFILDETGKVRQNGLLYKMYVIASLLKYVRTDGWLIIRFKHWKSFCD